MKAIVPAFNEEATVASVVRALVDADVFDLVVVVDDGSTDRTSELAAAAGARVVATPKNLGKGGAMLYAIEVACGSDEHVAFFDADLVGLRPEHVRRLADASALGYDMVCALRDKGAVQNALQIAFSPVITGERILARWIIDALPSSCWSGYSIETAMNDVVHRNGGRAALVFFDGVSMRTKSQKTGLIRGVQDHFRMARQIAQTRRALNSTRGLSCRI